MPRVNCPYCQHPSFEDISIKHPYQINPPQSDPVNKIDEVHRKIQQLDQTVEKLSKDRIDLLEELNEVQSPIGVLPQEVLSRIFEFACSPPESGSSSTTDSPFSSIPWRLRYSSVKKAQVLTNVSARWRKTALATPQVWTYLALIIERRTIESNVHFFRQFLDYSGHLPLTLSLQLSQFRFDADVLFHRSIDALLVKNLWRIKILQLDSPPQTWYSHLPQLTQLSHLLHISPRRMPPAVPLNQVSSLSEITFSGRPITFSSPYITTLNLYDVVSKSIFPILANCPNLVNLYIRRFDRATLIYADHLAPDEGDSSPVERFTLQHLEVFEWTVSHDDWELAILSHLHLPSLQSLSFIHLPCSRPGSFTELQEAATHFFTNLPTTLKSLEFCIFCDPRVELYKLDFPSLVKNGLRDDCQVESISLTRCQSTLATEILHDLIRPQRLPQLSRINLDGVWGNRENMISILRTFLDAVGKRFSGCERPLSLYLPKCSEYKDVEWLDCTRSELEELKRRGCEVEIFVNSMQVI